MVTFSHTQFSYNRSAKEFAAEISSLNNRVHSAFFLRGKKQTIEYVWADTKRDADGDVLYWLYVPDRSATAGKGTRVVIFND